VLNGLTCQEFLNVPRPFLSSVPSNLTNYTVEVFLEKQMVSYQVKISPQLWNPNVRTLQYSKETAFRTSSELLQSVLYPHSKFL